MLTYTGARNRYGTYTNNSTAANLTTGDGYINEAIKRILGNRNWPFLEKTDTNIQTTGSVQFYTLPFDYGKLNDVTVTVGSVLYHPHEVANRDVWDRMNYAQNLTSNIPIWYFVWNGQVGFWPKPSTSGNTITINYKKTTKDLSYPDYTTGVIWTSVNGSTTITGSATIWTPQMNGMFLQITGSTTINTGDNYWYEVSSASTTTINLVKMYQGASITNGNAAYILGQSMPLPEQYQVMPVYYAAMEYWRTNGNNLEKANEFKRMYDEMLQQFEADYGQKSVNPMIDNGIYEVENQNPNLTIFF